MDNSSSTPDLESAIKMSAGLPAQVFSADYQHFGVLNFELFAPWMWSLLTELANRSGDSTVILAKDPAEYVERNVIQVGSSIDEYRAGCSVEYEFAFGVYVWYPPSLRWVIWGEPMAEIAVLGLHREFLPFDLAALKDDVGPFVQTASEILERLSYGARNSAVWQEFAYQLSANYGNGEMWVDRSVELARSLAVRILADEIGILEGCEEMRKIARRFDRSTEHLFAPFEGVAWNAGGFPAGITRSEWDDRLLAELELQQARYVEGVRADVLRACERLLKQLR